MRVKPAKKKSDIRREMEEEKMVAKFTKKVEKKLNEILKKMEDLCELEMQVEEIQEENRRLEEEERKEIEKKQKKIAKEAKKVRKELEKKQEGEEEEGKRMMDELVGRLFEELGESIDQIIDEETYRARANNTIEMDDDFTELEELGYLESREF